MNKLVKYTLTFIALISLALPSFANDKLAPPKKPGRAKPDLIIYSIEKSNTNDKVMVVHVKNIGASKSVGGKVGVKLSSGASSQANMPDINPGQIRLVYVNFRSAIKGGRATATADNTKVIAESNESNNTKSVKI